MGGDAENHGELKGRARRVAGSVKARVESLVQPVPGHELADVRFERRTVIGPRSARSLAVIVAVLVIVTGGGMLIGQLVGGSGDGGTVTAEGLSPTGSEVLLTGALTPSPSAQPPGQAAGQAAGLTGGPAGGTPGDGTVVVAVQGMVESPGLRTVSEGTRLGEVLDLVGGIRPEARLEGVNLAEKVVDGMQVVVDADGSRVVYPGQSVAPGGANPAGTAGSGTVNINTADSAGLTTLPGVGEKTAEAIIAWREANGAFTSPEQLMEVRGIGAAKFEAMRDFVSV